jgi:hypothetical protein
MVRASQSGAVMLHRSYRALFVATAAIAACAGAAFDLGVNPAGGKADGEGLDLTDEQRDTIINQGATCPFNRTAVKQGAITVGGTPEHPLGSTLDAIALGNAGGGDLGRVMKFFIEINHNVVVGADGATTVPVPANTFSLWFPGSHGAHPGHSGILMGDPSNTRSGRLNIDRLADFESNYSTPYPDGKNYISLDQMGQFIAKNVAADPNSRGFNLAGATALARNIVSLTARALSGDPNLVDDFLHLFVTADDMFDSSGEFALLFARFSDNVDANGDPLVSTDVVQSLFVDGQFPPGWDQKPAWAMDWIKDSLKIAKSAVLASWGI